MTSASSRHDAPARAALRAALARDAAENGWPCAEAAALAASAALTWPRTGTALRDVGARGPAIVYVLTGVLQLGSPGGRATVMLAGPGTVFPFPVVGDAPLGAQALVPAVVAAWPAEQSGGGRATGLLAAVAARGRERLLEVAWRKSLCLGAPLPDRLLHELTTLASDFGRPHAAGTLVQLSVTHADLARLVGATRANVTRALARLRRAGRIVVEDGSLVVCDAAARPATPAPAAVAVTPASRSSTHHPASSALHAPSPLHATSAMLSSAGG